MRDSRNITVLPFSENLKDRYKVAWYLAVTAILVGGALILVVGGIVPGPMRAGVVGGLVGGLAAHYYAWATTVKARLEIMMPGVVDDVVGYLRFVHYVEFQKGCFRWNGPSFLRFDSGNVYLRADGDRLTVVGPLLLLRKINQIHFGMDEFGA